MLYTWPGTDPAAKPVILMGHQDVVPVAPGAEQNWAHPAFAGEVAEGFIWGRGAMDCKGIMLGVMEAVEGLLAEGYRPRRTVYLCFGHDEEVGGNQGAVKMAAILKERGVRAEWVVDESGMIVDGKSLGINKLMAMIGIAEKGYLSLELKATAKGGHSSTPPRESAIGALSRAVARVEGWILGISGLTSSISSTGTGTMLDGAIAGQGGQLQAFHGRIGVFQAIAQCARGGVHQDAIQRQPHVLDEDDELLRQVHIHGRAAIYQVTVS